MKHSNNELARMLIDSMTNRDFSAVEPYMSDDLRLNFPGAGTLEGKRRVLVFLNAMLRKYPGLVFKVTDVFSTDTRSCIVWINSGEDINGQAYENSGTTVIHYNKGKFVYLSDYFKDTSFRENSK